MKVIAVVDLQDGKCIVVSETSLCVVHYANLTVYIQAHTECVCIYHEECIKEYLPTHSRHMRAYLSDATRCCIEWTRHPLQEWSKRHRQQNIHGPIEAAKALLEVYEDYVSFQQKSNEHSKKRDTRDRG